MSIQVQEDKQVGLVTLVCDGQWVLVAGHVIGKGTLPAGDSSASPQVITAGGGPSSPSIPLPPPPPPPFFSVSALGPKLMNLKLHESLKPAFDSLVHAGEFKTFAGSLSDRVVLTITPAEAGAKKSKMPTQVTTHLGDVPFLHQYVPFK